MSWWARALPAERPDVVRALGTALGGVAVGVVAVGLFASGGAVMIAAGIGVLCLLLPMLLIRDVAHYWLFGYLFFLPFEFGLRLTGRGADMQALIDAVGVPPTSWTDLKIFPTDLVLLALLVWWIAGLRSGRFQLVMPGVSWCLVAAFFWSLAGSALVATRPMLAAAQLVHDAKYLLVFFLFASTLRSRRDLRFVLGVLLAAVAMECVIATALWATGYARDSLADAVGAGVSHDFGFLREQEQDLQTSAFRASGTFGAASHMSMYMQFAIFLPLALAATTRDPRRRLALFALYLVGAVVEVLTLSRAGFLGLVAGSSVGGAILIARGYVRARPLAALLFLGVVGVGSQVPRIYDMMASRPETFWHRFTLFQEGGALVAANPLFGVGANNSTAARLRQAADAPVKVFTSSAVPAYDNLYPIHNQFIVVAAEIGLVGFALVAVFFLATAWRALRLTGSSDPIAATVGIWLLCSYVGIAGQLSGDHFPVNAARTMLWLVSAAVFAVDSAAPRPAGRSPA